jgi:aspartate/glutamate racemase
MSTDWPTACSRLLKAEIARTDITLAKLAKRLQRLGVEETETTLKNKLYRGTFSMTFFMQCMRALGQGQVDVNSVIAADVPKGKELDRPSDAP